MENLLLIIIVFVATMFTILAFIVVRNEKEREEFEHYMNEHPEKRYGYTDGQSV